jgi:hypothetical protein
MAIVIRNVPPEGLTDTALENRLAFRQWGGDAVLPIRVSSPFSRYGETMMGEPEPCMICGAPAGDCTSHDQGPAGSITFGGGGGQGDVGQGGGQGDAGQDDKGAKTMTRTQGDLSGNDDPNATLYVCPDDVVEEFYPTGSSRKTRRLVARKGETILRERAVQLGLVEGAPKPGIPNAEIVTREGASVGLQ